ncbi:TolB family protein [Bacteroidota bacterium]
MKTLLIIASFAIITIIVAACLPGARLGIFDANNDIGRVKHKGSVKYSKAENAYTISGSGTNMWFDKDELHFVWKKLEGDLAISADIEWVGEGVDPHRKACVIFRESLDTNAVYADIAVHGDGLTSIQYREEVGGMTREVQSKYRAPKRVRLEKIGAYVSMSLSMDDLDPEYSGGTFRLPFEGDFYVGLGVCSHNPDVIETARFSNVTIEAIEARPDEEKQLESTLEIIPISSFDRKVIYHTKDHIEAPNWTPDGKTLIFNSNGLLYSIPAEGGTPEQIPTGFANRINNDHGVSPDGSMLVISDQTETGSSMIYSLPIKGGDPKKVTTNSPSYWHGWSPDGKTLTYCAERNANYDIYTIPLKGGRENRLTTAEGLDDGPEYSPDGKYIYFNSVRSGTMQIWRMKVDGSDEEQVTTDDLNDWFAHPSPDGKWIVYVTFGKDVPAGSHPPNKDVMLRLMNLETKEVQVMAKLFGGQGTINVPSWSPDSQSLAFVSYRLW